ncbi:hypothetical protein DY000_02015277 [Brassica cretica]|uniref:Uncharacterized protein n=1 Tax=Brassica cretica TaxID=69181 RepID=A0ABQ7D6Q6_BRACR|nr:hypothetical protein DY000_02015277 [Brassica cretica]
MLNLFLSVFKRLHAKNVAGYSPLDCSGQALPSKNPGICLACCFTVLDHTVQDLVSWSVLQIGIAFISVVLLALIPSVLPNIRINLRAVLRNDAFAIVKTLCSVIFFLYGDFMKKYGDWFLCLSSVSFYLYLLSNLEPGAQIENVEEAHEQEVQVEIPEAEPVDIHVQLVMVQIDGDGVAEDNQPNHGGAEDNQGAEPGTERNESKWCYILTLFMYPKEARIDKLKSLSRIDCVGLSFSSLSSASLHRPKTKKKIDSMASELAEKAKEAFLEDDFDVAVDLYSRAIDLDPNCAAFFADRAQANIKILNFTEAVADANKAIELEPTLSKAYLRKGTACMKLEEYSTAKAALQKGASVAPNESKFNKLIDECNLHIAEEEKDLAQQMLPTLPSSSTTPPLATAAPAKPMFRHEFYQKPEEVVVTVFAKGIPKQNVNVEFGDQILSVVIDVAGEEAYHFQPRLFGKIIPDKCRYEVLSTKVEIRLAKAEIITWASLEYVKGQALLPKPNVASEEEKDLAQQMLPTLPSSSTTPPLATAAPAKPMFRHEFYQKPEEVVVTVFAKGIPKQNVNVEFGDQILSVVIDVAGEEAYHFQPRLFGKIIPDKCRYEVLSTKVEIRLAKAEIITWASLEYVKGQALLPKPNVASAVSQRPVYPSSKPAKDWDKLEAEVKKQEKDEKLDGDAAMNKFFSDIYQSADEDMRRAMNKSFAESNGTVLSTNWKEVGTKKVESTPPDGMELKKWEY